MCDVCNGLPGCPVCAPEAKTKPCPDCEGGGKRYFYSPDGNEPIEINPDELSLIPFSDRLIETCHHCDGKGEILN